MGSAMMDQRMTVQAQVHVVPIPRGAVLRFPVQTGVIPL